MSKLVLILSMVLTGCCANGIPNFTAGVPDIVSDNTHKMTIGLLEGSYTTINDEWSITVAHNKPIITLTGRTVFYHPTCDIALIKTRGKTDNNVKLGVYYPGDSLHNAGYPPFPLPLAYDKLEYLGDVSGVGHLGTDKCPAYSYANGIVMGGMSGGGVWNSKNELVGVNVGFADITELNGVKHDSAFIFVPLLAVKDWIHEVTGLTVSE